MVKVGLKKRSQNWEELTNLEKLVKIGKSWRKVTIKQKKKKKEEG